MNLHNFWLFSDQSQTYDTTQDGGDISFTGTSPGEFNDVIRIKITIRGQDIELLDVAIEICHHPGKLGKNYKGFQIWLMLDPLLSLKGITTSEVIHSDESFQARHYQVSYLSNVSISNMPKTSNVSFLLNYVNI